MRRPSAGDNSFQCTFMACISAGLWSCGRYSLFCINISYILIQGSTSLKFVGKDHLQLLAVSLVFSQPSDEVMQLVTYVQDIYDHASLHSKNKEEAASGTSMLATPIYTVDSKNGNVLVTSSWTAQKLHRVQVRVSAMLVVIVVTWCEHCTTDNHAGACSAPVNVNFGLESTEAHLGTCVH